MTEDVPQRPRFPVPSGILLDSRCETALARLVRALRSEATHVALVGPAAAGKTSLIRELPQRLGRSFACAHLPQPWLGPDEIRAWIDSFDGPLPADAGTTLEDLVYAYARRGAGLALLIDDANGMPLEVARALDPLVERTGRALRLVLVGLDDARFEAVLACFDAPFERIVLEAPDPADAGLAVVERAPPFEMQRIRPASPAAGSSRDAASNPKSIPRRGLDRSASVRARLVSLLPEKLPRLPTVAAAVTAVAVAFVAGRWSATSTNEPESTSGATSPATLPSVGSPPQDAVAAVSSRSAQTVRVHVNARPWARVSVDGREIGITPLGNVPLEPGRRRFRAEFPDGRVVERDVEISAGNRRVTFQ